MEHIARVFARSIFAIILLLTPGIAQEMPQTTVTGTPITGPAEPKVSETGEVLGEYLTATYNTYENIIHLAWEGDQPCFFGGDLIFEIYEDGNLIWQHNYGPIAWLWGYWGTWDLYRWPNTTHSYTFKRRGSLCDNDAYFYATGKTDLIRKPVNLVVANTDSSDRDIGMSWSNGSSLGTYRYDIFKNGEMVASTGSTSYTVHTIPGEQAIWGVAAVTPYGYSQRTEAIGRTASFIVPENLTASVDTTVGYVRLNWGCASDYATHFVIDRDGLPLDTIPVSGMLYLDSSAVPRGGAYYEYHVRSYNTGTGLSSAPSNLANGRAAFLNASDGSVTGKVIIEWNGFPDTVRGVAWTDLRLYRDAAQLPGVVPGNVYKEDGGALPGKLHTYRLDVLDINTVVLSLTDFGFTPADGEVGGWVHTPGGAGVNTIEMRVVPPEDFSHGALYLDGIDGRVVAPPLNLNTNAVTMTAWIRSAAGRNDWSGIFCSRGGNTAAGLHLMADGELRYNWNDDPAAWGWSSGLIVPESVWTFVALIVEPDRATIMLNDTFAVRPAPHSPEEFDGAFVIGWDPSDTLRHFRGRIDEVNVWKSARTMMDVLAGRHHLVRGDENGLVASWNFNDSGAGAAGDFADNGNHHGAFLGDAARVGDSPPVWHYGYTKSNGDYSIKRVNWEQDMVFTVRPYKEGHGFRGATFPADSMILTFTGGEYIHQNINFFDTTSIGISGTVRTEGDPACPVTGVKILVDGVFTGVSTDSAGFFSISVAEAGQCTVSVEYGTHGFLRRDTVMNVQDPVTDLEFIDTTRTVLSGTVGGSCDNFLGVGSLRIRSASDGCLDTTVHTDATGLYGVTLPAQVYAVSLIAIDHPESLAIINAFAVDTFDLTEQDTVLDFIYHPEPVTRISEMPPVGCGQYAVPILDQEITYSMRIDVTEAFGDLECPVDSGTVTVSDYAGYAFRETTITLQDGFLYYPLTPGYPNIAGGGAHPYQKMVVLRTDIGAYRTFDTLWVFVEGQRPREFEFSTVSPEIPLMILRDPPGDMSYSYLSSTTTSSVNLGFSFESTIGAGAFAKFRVGGGLEVPGLGPIGVWGAGEAEASVGLRSAINGTQEIRISASEMLKTSDADAITGPEGDVFMGAALNLLYAKTDIVEYNADSCMVKRDTGIVWNGDGFRTTYLYTESHIVNSVIPDLELMAQILNSTGDPAKMDSAEVLLNQADVWRQVVQFNDSIKQHAVTVPEFPDNVSFSAGADLNEEATISSTTTLSIALNLFVDASVALSAGAKQGEFNEVEGGVKIFTKLDIGTTVGAGYEVTNTVGFTLADDDASPPGDAFWVDIKGDPVYGTPVFGLLSGQSSCPWEHPTLPREGVGMTMNTFVMENVPPDVPAQFDLYLYNLGQNDETRTYLLSLIQGSNPDGAIISVGGAVLGDDQLQFSLPPSPDSAQRATLRVAREAGSVYDYEGLQLHLYSPCDGRIDTSVSFSVHFIKPCSDVRVARPGMNWILNHSQNKQMLVVLKDYDAADENLQVLKFEYRIMGATEWTELFSYPRALLPPDSIAHLWDLSAVTEGAYELRASTFCTMGTYYSRSYPGIYDCTLPACSGTPEPADGFLDPGDEISITFTENIDCASANDSSITVTNITQGGEIEVNVECAGDELILTPVNGGNLNVGDSVVVTIDSFSDPFGNPGAGQVAWSFIVNTLVGIPDQPAAEIPSEFILYQSYPNPFNPEMTIRFGLPKATDVSLVIYDITGREVMRIAEGIMPAGYHEKTVNAGHLSSGIYLYRLRTPEFQNVRKMVLMK